MGRSRDSAPPTATPGTVRLILVCGSRRFANRELVRDMLACYLPDDPAIDEPTIMHGDARGADTLAKEEASDLGFWVEAWPADWEKHGKAAGPIRNRAMLDQRPDMVLAFRAGGSSPGTDDCVAEARKRGIPVVLVDPTQGEARSPNPGQVPNA